MTRRECREHLFCLMFQRPFYPVDEFMQQRELFLGEQKKLSPKDQQELITRSDDVISHMEEIDVYIEKYSKGWTLDRIGKAELTILRIAVFESLFDEEVPVGVAVNEAVELAKKYGDDNASSFVNGILGKIVNE